MKKFILIAMMTCSLTALTACGADAPDETPPTETAEVTPEPSGEIDDLLGDMVPLATFELSQEEKELYDTYAKDLDTTIFKDVPRASIAKIFIQCGIDNNLEAEYGMFSPSTTEGSLEQYLEDNTDNENMTPIEQRQALADYLFGSFDEGTYIEKSDTTSQLEFETTDGQIAQFNFVKDENDVWRVNYNTLSQDQLEAADDETENADGDADGETLE